MHLLAGADQRNAGMLKVGYFLNHRRSSFPVADGYQLVLNQLGQEQPYSPRWFALKSISGWAALRVGGDRSADSLKAYEDIFSHYEEARKSRAIPIVRRAIYEYVSTVPTQYLSWNDVDLEKVQQTLQKGFLASMVIGEKGFFSQLVGSHPPFSQKNSTEFSQKIKIYLLLKMQIA
jgi:hypothetical protein